MDAAQDASFQAALAAEYAALERTVAEFDGRLLTVKSWSVSSRPSNSATVRTSAAYSAASAAWNEASCAASIGPR